MMEARAILAWPVLMVQLLIFGTAAFTLTLGAEIVASNGGSFRVSLYSGAN